MCVTPQNFILHLSTCLFNIIELLLFSRLVGFYLNIVIYYLSYSFLIVLGAVEMEHEEQILKLRALGECNANVP